VWHLRSGILLSVVFENANQLQYINTGKSEDVGELEIGRGRVGDLMKCQGNVCVAEYFVSWTSSTCTRPGRPEIKR